MALPTTTAGGVPGLGPHRDGGRPPRASASRKRSKSPGPRSAATASKIGRGARRARGVRPASPPGAPAVAEIVPARSKIRADHPQELAHARNQPRREAPLVNLGAPEGLQPAPRARCAGAGATPRSAASSAATSWAAAAAARGRSRSASRLAASAACRCPARRARRRGAAGRRRVIEQRPAPHRIARPIEELRQRRHRRQVARRAVDGAAKLDARRGAGRRRAWRAPPAGPGTPSAARRRSQG